MVYLQYGKYEDRKINDAKNGNAFFFSENLLMDREDVKLLSALTDEEKEEFYLSTMRAKININGEVLSPVKVLIDESGVFAKTTHFQKNTGNRCCRYCKKGVLLQLQNRFWNGQKKVFTKGVRRNTQVAGQQDARQPCTAEDGAPHTAHSF